MGVGTEGDARVGVTEPAGDGPHADAAAGQRGGSEVAERAQLHVVQPRPPAQTDEGGRHPARPVGRRAVERLGPDVGVGSQGDAGQLGPLDRAGPLAPQDLDGGRVECEAPGPVGLGVLHRHLARHVGDGPGHDESGPGQVDVAPAQAAQLAPPATGGDGHVDQAAEVVVGPVAQAEQGADLGHGRRYHLGRPRGGRGRPLDGLRSIQPHFTAWRKAAERMAWHLRTDSGLSPLLRSRA